MEAGYKQTEVGVIPEDWEVAFVKDSYTINNNLRFPLSEAVRKEMQGSFPYYGPTKIQDYINEFRVEGEYCLIGEDGDHFLKWQSMPMTILVNGKFNVNNHAHLVRGVDNETVWFYYYFNNRDITKHLTRQGAGRYKLTKASLKNIPIAIPSTKTEQIAIAHALSDADAWIQSLTRLIAKKHQIKQGAMQTLLNPYENGRLKAGWVVKKLGDVAEFINGRAYSISEWETYGVPVIRLQNLTGRGERFYYSNLELPSKQYCKNGDLLFMWSATFGPVIWRGKTAIYHYHIWKIQCRPTEANKKYLFYLLDDLTEKLKRSSSSGGTMLHVTKKKMESTEVTMPIIAEQAQIATILSDIDNEITALETKLAKARTIKQGMMQNLLTGRIRLI